MGEGEKTSLDLIVTAQEAEDSLLYLTVTMSDNNSIKRSSLLTIEATGTATPQVIKILFNVMLTHMLCLHLYRRLQMLARDLEEL